MAEIGTDLERFPSAGHLAVVGGHVPWQQRERRQAPQRQDPQRRPWLRAALIEAAQAAGAHAQHLPAAQYHRLAARRGKKKALVAVGHTILVIAYHLLRGTDYRDLGPTYFDQRDRQAVERRLDGLGYRVAWNPAPPDPRSPFSGQFSGQARVQASSVRTV